MSVSIQIETLTLVEAINCRFAYFISDKVIQVTYITDVVSSNCTHTHPKLCRHPASTVCLS